MEIVLLLVLIGISGSLAWQVRRLRAIDHRLKVLLRHFELAPAGYQPSERVRLLVADPDKKIAAIKAVREETGLGLAEARDLVEELIDGHSTARI